MKNEKERAIKAECAQLETTLDFGVKILERAQQDCKIQIRHFENLLKNPLSESDQSICNKNIAAWKEKIEEIKKLIVAAKTEFHGHITEIKKGKSLASLPKLTVAKPPPQPVLPTLSSQQPPSQQQPQQQQQQMQQQVAQMIQPSQPQGHIHPHAIQRRMSPHSINAQFAQQQQQYQERGMISPSHNKAASSRGSITPQPIGNFPIPRGGVPQNSGYQMPIGRPNSTVGISPTSKGLLPIGVRPPNFTTKNGIIPTTPQHPNMMKDNLDNAAAAMLSAVGNMSSPNRTLTHSPPVTNYGGVSAAQDMFNMNTTARSATAAPMNARNTDYRWYDPLNAYNDFFSSATNEPRNNWNIGGDFLSANRNATNTASPNVSDPGSAPVSSGGMNRGPPRTGWFEAENAPVMSNRPS